MIKIPAGQVIIATLLLQFATVSPCPPNCSCDKGNAHCSRMSLTAVPANVDSNTTSIDMSFNNISTLTNNDFVNLTHLKILLLDNNDISSLEPYVFHQMIKLLHLNLNNNKISVLNLNLFKSLNQLRHLYLQNNDIEYVPPQLFEYNQNLVLLDISENHIQNFEPETFQNNPILSWVNVRGNPLTLPLEMKTRFNNAFNILEIEFCDSTDSPISAFQNVPSVQLIGTKYTTAVNLDEFTSFPDDLGLDPNETAYLGMKMFSRLNSFSFESVHTMLIGDDSNVMSTTGEDILCYCQQHNFWYWCIEETLTRCEATVTKSEIYEILGCNADAHNATSYHREAKEKTPDTKKRERLFWPYHCPVNRNTLQTTLLQAAIPMFIIVLVVGVYIFRRVRSARRNSGSLPSYVPVKS